LAAVQKFQLNVLFGQCHSNNSLHYSGKAVDLGCSPPVNLSQADSVAARVGVERNFENCTLHNHWHYSVKG
jgi:hypothetical protein